MKVTDEMVEAAWELLYTDTLNSDDGKRVRAAIEAALAAAPQGEWVAFHELLREAEAEVRAKPVWKRYIDGTPLANDVPVWMAVFAQHHARTAGPPAPAAQPRVPDGWVPLTITYEGDTPEEVAYGPPLMMNRLKKWLDKHFARVIAEKNAPAQPSADLERLRALLADSVQYVTDDGLRAAIHEAMGDGDDV